MANKPHPPILIHGRTTGAVNVPVQVDASGVVQTSPVVGIGDASAANQTLEIAAINKINAQILDLDTGGGTANTVGLFIALPSSGGPVAGGTSTNPLGVLPSSSGYSAAVAVTRPSDTNAYTGGDVIGASTGSTAALDFASMGVSGGRIIITGASLMIAATAVISGEASYQLHLYSVTPPSALGDNTAFDLPAGDRASYLGYLDLGTPIDLGSTLFIATDGIGKPLKLAGTNLFGYLTTVNTYTPTSGRVYTVTIHAVSV